MKSAIIPDNEEERLKVLKQYRILDTFAEKEYDAITKIASSICDVPVAMISIVDEDRQWFKSKIGTEIEETSRDVAFCAHAILNPNEVFEVEDSKKDDRFHDNPLATESNVIFYAGATLNSPEGHALGTLCVIDEKPKKLTDSQREALKQLANQVVSLLKLRKSNLQLKEANDDVIKLNKRLNDFAYRLTHDLKSPINNINFLLDVLNTDHKSIFQNTEAEEYINLISNRVFYMENLIQDMLQYAKVTTKNIAYTNFNLNELVNSIISNIDVEGRIVLNSNLSNTDIYSSKIAFLLIFQNLISNSKKYSDEEKVIIDIDFIDTKSTYNFIYKDNGPGIPEEYWTKVFEMFETLDQSNNSTGIGLGTVKSSVERLGGSIYLSKRRDGKKGACFNFSIKKKLV